MPSMHSFLFYVPPEISEQNSYYLAISRFRWIVMMKVIFKMNPCFCSRFVFSWNNFKNLTYCVIHVSSEANQGL